MQSSPQYQGGQHRPDWYPDPTRRFEFRYHNGLAWTGDVATDGNRYLDPLPTGPFAAGPLPASGGGWPAQQPERMTAAVAAFVLGICSIFVGWVPFLCVLSGIGAIVGIVLGIGVLRGDSRRRRDGGVDSRGHGYALAGVILAPIGLAVTVVGIWLTVVTLREVDEYTNVGDHRAEIVSCGVADGVASAAGTVTNETDRTRTYQLTIDFHRAGSSARLDSGAVTVHGVGGGETAEWTVTESVDLGEQGSPAVENIDCTIREITGPVPFGVS